MATDRYIDLLKQGFMKSLKKPRKVKPAPKVRACDKCRDWHSGSCKKFQERKIARGLK